MESVLSANGLLYLLTENGKMRARFIHAFLLQHGGSSFLEERPSQFGLLVLDRRNEMHNESELE